MSDLDLDKSSVLRVFWRISKGEQNSEKHIFSLMSHKECPVMIGDKFHMPDPGSFKKKKL